MPTPAEIAAFVNANLNNPQAIVQAANQYGVSLNDIASATGYSGQEIGSYLGDNGLTSAAFTAAPPPPAPAPSSGPLSATDVAGARDWLTSQGYGTNGPGGFQYTGANNNNYNGMVAGAAQSKGWGANELSQILGGNFSTNMIQDWLTQNKPIVDTYQTVFEADRARAPAAPIGNAMPRPPVVGNTPGMGNAPGMPMRPPMPPGGGSAGMSTAPSGSYQQNPYLSGIADDITRRIGTARDQGLKAVRSDAIAMGGAGGTGQSFAEADVISRSLDNLGGQLTGLYGQDWNNQQNRDLQRYGMDQGFYTSQRGQDLAQIGLGSQLESQALQNQWYPISQFANIVGNLSGQNTSTTNSSQTGGGALGTLGGLLGTAQLGTNLKWW